MKLSTVGTKKELILQLSNVDPNIWTNITVTEIADVASGEGSSDSLSEARDTRDMATIGEIPDHIRREFDLLRREKALLERKLQLASRAAEGQSDSRMSVGIVDSGQTLHSNININNIGGLFGEFQGSNDSFQTWEKQIELLRRIYNLNDDMTKVLIGAKLKGKALRWFHSRPDYLEMFIAELLREMRAIFDHRPSRQMLRKGFEQRMWRSGESFADYYLDKIILANRVPIDEGEILDRVIDGISDHQLHNHARTQRFGAASELLEAFKKITLRPEKEHSTLGARDGKGARDSVVANRVSESLPRNRAIRCYNCSE